MKLRNILLACITYSILLTQLLAQNSTPVVSNSRFEQRIDGSFKVDIYYDVNDADGDAMTISIRVSNDGGATWDFSATKFNDGGDIGEGITSGTNKQIVWDFGTEHPETFGDQFMIEISADDGVGECPPIVVYSGKTYNTVQIGEQCWLKENLDVGTMINGSSWPSNNSTIEKYCYNNDPNNCESYGGLYRWNESMQYVTTENAKGICPDGWHIPTDTELKSLKDFVGGNRSGNSLKAIGQGTGNGIGTNTSGFTALLSGNIYDSFYGLGIETTFWSSSERLDRKIQANLIRLLGDDIFIRSELVPKKLAGSIRCLKDGGIPIIPPNIPSIPSPADSSEGINVNNTLLWDCSDPNEDLLTYDIYFGTNSNPALAESNLSNNSYNPPQLDKNITYYWKVVAKNSNGGVTEGPIWRFKTEVDFNGETGTFTDTRDGQVYKWIKIGEQIWMAENLNYKTNSGSWAYNHDLNNAEIYGRLYDWETANTSCPSGWHLPSDNEWKKLEIHLGMSEDVANLTGWRGNNEGTELKEGGSSGLKVLFGGYYYPAASKFGGKNSIATFWLSDDVGFSTWHRRLSLSETKVFRSKSYNCVKVDAFSVRAIKDY